MAKILICDDAGFMRATIREALEKEGHEVIAEAEDSDEAIALYKTNPPDIVTMDLLMKIDGTETVRKIKEIDPNAKIIIVSVLNAQEAEVIDAIRAGASGIVTKPINRKVLLTEINRILEES